MGGGQRGEGIRARKKSLTEKSKGGMQSEPKSTQPRQLSGGSCFATWASTAPGPRGERFASQ